MVDITKDEIWDSRNNIEYKIDKNVFNVKKAEKSHKFLKLACIGLIIFISIDFVLIYEFINLLKIL